jgi:hypothetical protein
MRELFRDGDWKIVESSTDYIGVYHRCKREVDPDRNKWWHFAGTTGCFVCGAKTPREMVGLLLLHKWER